MNSASVFKSLQKGVDGVSLSDAAMMLRIRVLANIGYNLRSFLLNRKPRYCGFLFAMPHQIDNYNKFIIR